MKTYELCMEEGEVTSFIAHSRSTRLIARMSREIPDASATLVRCQENNFRIAYVENLFVAPEYRQQGTGADLIKRMQVLAKQNKADVLMLVAHRNESELDDAALISWHTDLGFHQYGSTDTGLLVAMPLNIHANQAIFAAI